jgi:hypothetical protein
MSLKLAQDVWYELWEEAGSRGLDTWHALEERAPGQSATQPSGAGGDEREVLCACSSPDPLSLSRQYRFYY